MNIAIGKIGQKLVFDRQSKDALRSNGNGNVGAYKFFDLIISENSSHTFCCIGDSDLDVVNQYDNVKMVTDFDLGLFMVGINDDEKMIDKINQMKCPYILFCDDPRCLDSLNKNDKLSHLPRAIFGQKDERYSFKGVIYNIKYFPMEFALAYKEKILKPKKKSTLISILANYCDSYPRLEIIQSLIRDKDYKVYGKLDKTKDYPSNFEGEKTFDEAHQLLKNSKFTLIVPVRENCVTSKYLEAIMLGVYPIFYKSYGWRYLKAYFRNVIVVETQDELEKILTSKQHFTKQLLDMQKFIKKLTFGETLNTYIRREVYDLCGFKL